MSQALGRGLSALIAESVSVIGEMPAKNGGVVELPLSQLRPGKYQPRAHFDEEALRELADSIREQGVIQPILVRPTGDGLYEIMAGERRFRACGEAGLATIPALIKEDVADLKALEIALIENVQRQDLNVIEEAEGYQRLQEEFAYTQEQLAKMLGKSRSHIANILRLLKLSEETRNLIRSGELTMGHVRAMLGLTPDDQMELAQKILDGGLNVREAERLAGEVKSPASGKKSKKAATSAPQAPYVPLDKNEDVQALERALSATLGLKVQIDDDENGGTVTVHFHNLSELDRIMQRLGG